MKHICRICLALVLPLTSSLLAGETEKPKAAKSISQYGITWTFDKDYPRGRFCNGDYWVVGPVKIVSITNDLHTQGFTPGPGQDGSMINPDGGGKQGYDDRLRSYKAELNAGRPNGKPLSSQNPITLKPGDTLISMVSWLARSNSDKEPGCPRYNGGTKAPRPVTRSGAVLTCLAEAPKPDSFRPGYCGSGKTVKFNKADLKLDGLGKLKPIPSTPALAKIERSVARPWIDHCHQYLGAMVHPTENMPEYGQRMGHALNLACLVLNLDFDQLPSKPSKEKLAIGLTQIGIDLTSVADAGGGWPANGGHHMGRKMPILIAGVLLDDEHMKNVGQWKTRFQENENTFYVTQKEVDLTNSSKWAPDKRAKLTPYTKADIGTPEWGIRHSQDPQCDNADWSAIYRSINNSVFPGIVLTMLAMDQKAAWNHDALFDYTDRAMKKAQGKRQHGEPRFVTDMWAAYRKNYPVGKTKVESKEDQKSE